MSCKHKRELFTACRTINDPDLLSTISVTAKSYPLLSRKQKKLNYADKIKKASNKNKTI